MKIVSRWRSYRGRWARYLSYVAEYRSSEGKSVTVPYRGPVAGTCKEILGGVRSTCTYVGASKLKEISKVWM